MDSRTPPRSLEKAVEHVKDLPAMPQAAAETLRLMDDRNADAMEISAALERDPALAAKVLRLANSSYYGLKRQVGSMRLALVVLGMREVRNVVIAMTVVDTAHGSLVGDPLIQEMWSHSLEVAALSKKLGAELRLGLQGEDFIGGLLHDVGKAVLLSHFGKDYRRMYLKAGGAGPLTQVERDYFGCSHAEVGAALMQHWSLPEALVDALWFHHSEEDLPLRDAHDPALAAVVRLANLAAHDDLASGPPSASKACQDGEAWSQLDRAPGAPRPEQRYSLLAPFKASIQNLPAPAL